MEFDSQLVRLSAAFYADYPIVSYPELLEKDNRSYNCLLVELHDDLFICLPYRSYIRHKYAFRFKHSKRSKTRLSGIDYSKMVIIKDLKYISNAVAVVDKDEYNETMQNINTIATKAVEYLDDYIAYIRGESNMSEKEFDRRYKHSTLPYFDNLLKNETITNRTA